MELKTIAADAVKSDRLGYVKGYLVRFGTPEAADLEGEYFTAQTDFGFPVAKGARVPLNVYYHHGMDPKIGRKSIGTGWIKADETGLWYEAQLDLADEYAAMVAKLCKEGKMGYSSGAAGHLVERKSVGAGTEITRWPIAEASITPTPAEWRNTVKSIMDMEMPEMDEGEMEMPEMVEEPISGETPQEYADAIFADVRMEMIHEGLEALFEALNEGMHGLAVTVADVDRRAFADALIQSFAARASEMVASLDMGAKSLQGFGPDTLRSVERRLRDAVGLSRSNAKRLAPMVWDALRDADQIEDQDVSSSMEAKASDDTERSALMERLLMLELMR